MADVLGALEYSESKAGQEVPRRQETGGRSKSESRVLLQEIADFLQLRYTVRLEDPLLLQCLENPLILHARVFRHQVQHSVEDTRPSVVLRFGVGNGGYRVAVLVGESDFGNDLATGAVLLVGEARVIHVEIRLVLGHQVVAIVEVGGVTGKPGIFNADGIVGEQGHAVQGRALS